MVVSVGGLDSLGWHDSVLSLLTWSSSFSLTSDQV